MRPLLALAVFNVALLVSACAGSKALTGPELEAHLAERMATFEEAFRSKSVDAIMAMFASEPEVVPNGRSMKGEENVRAVMSQSVGGVNDFGLNIQSVTEGEGTFEQRGTFVLNGGTAPGGDGNFVAVWTRAESGEWLISRLAWSEY